MLVLMKTSAAKMICTCILYLALTYVSLLSPSPAHAHCVYNNTGYALTVIRLPFNIFTGFAYTIPAGESTCCNWQHGGCVSSDGQYGKTKFAIYSGSVSVSDLAGDAIMSWGNVLKDILRLIDDARNAGQLTEWENAVKDLALFVAGRPTSAQVMLSDEQDFINDFEHALSLPLHDEVIAYGETYNGGILDIRQESFGIIVPLGCWIGFCRGQGLNYDGTTGRPGTYQTCPSERICISGCCDAGYECSGSGMFATCTKSPPRCGNEQCKPGQVCLNGDQCCDSLAVCDGVCCRTGTTCSYDEFGERCRHARELTMSLEPAPAMSLLPGKPMTMYHQEQRRHARRTARLRRIQAVATEVGNADALERAKALLSRELERHERWMASYAQKAAAPPGPGDASAGGHDTAAGQK